MKDETKELKTLKELADELGVSKQAVRKHFDKLPPTLVPTKENGKYLLSLEIQNFIRSKVSTVDTTKVSTVDTTKVSTVDTLVDTLKDELISEKNSQITDLRKQNNDLRKLLDQQQQLQFKTQQMLEEKTLLLDTARKRKWWNFLKK